MTGQNPDRKKSSDPSSEQGIVSLESTRNEAIRGASAPPAAGGSYSPSEGEPSEPTVEEIPENPNGGDLPITGTSSMQANRLSIGLELSIGLTQQ